MAPQYRTSNVVILWQFFFSAIAIIVVAHLTHGDLLINKFYNLLVRTTTKATINTCKSEFTKYLVSMFCLTSAHRLRKYLQKKKNLICFVIFYLNKMIF